MKRKKYRGLFLSKTSQKKYKILVFSYSDKKDIGKFFLKEDVYINQFKKIKEGERFEFEATERIDKDKLYLNQIVINKIGKDVSYIASETRELLKPLLDKRINFIGLFKRIRESDGRTLFESIICNELNNSIDHVNILTLDTDGYTENQIIKFSGIVCKYKKNNTTFYGIKDFKLSDFKFIEKKELSALKRIKNLYSSLKNKKALEHLKKIEEKYIQIKKIIG